MVEVIEAERLVRRDRHGQQPDHNEEECRRIVRQTAQAKTAVDPQAQEHCSAAKEQSDHRRERGKRDEESLGDDGVHHHARHASTPAAAAQNTPAFLKRILGHTVTSPS